VLARAEDDEAEEYVSAVSVLDSPLRLAQDEIALIRAAETAVAAGYASRIDHTDLLGIVPTHIKDVFSSVGGDAFHLMDRSGHARTHNKHSTYTEVGVFARITRVCADKRKHEGVI
jgi:hypothetical protein